MTSSLNFVPNGFILHSWLSNMESLGYVLFSGFIIAVTLAVLMRQRRHYKEERTKTRSTLPAMTASFKSSATATNWTLRSLINRRIKVRISDEERRGREMFERLESIIPTDKPHGFARIWSIFSLAVIVASWAGWAWLAIVDHQQIVELRVQLHDAELRELQRRDATQTYTWFAILKVYDRWNFQVQFIDGGDPFLMKFVHDGSENKLGWDEGMIIESCTFEKQFEGLSVARENLGMKVHRDPLTSQFIDYRSAAWITQRQSQR